MSWRALTLALTFAVTATVSAGDWPRWRGPNNDGISTETGLLKEWPKDGPPLAWTAEKLGTGYGTPSVADGMIYGIGSRGGEDGVWALKEAGGKEQWFTPFTATAKVGNNTNGPSSTPTVAKGKVYAVSLGGTLGCLDAKSGKKVWEKNYGKDFGTKGLPIWGFNESVLVDGDKVICAPSSDTAALAALKADTGEVIWKTSVGTVGGGAGYSSTIKATIAGTPMYVTVLGQSAGIVGFDAETGKKLWQYNKSALGGTAQIPTPIVKGDNVWFSTGYGGGSALLKITSKGGEYAAEMVQTYTERELKNHHGGMVLIGDYVYFGHGQNAGAPRCVDIRTGDVVWKKEALGGGSSAYLYADGLLYIRYQDGKMFLVKPSPKPDDFKVVSSFQLPKPNTPRNTESWPHPVIANGKLYVRDQNNLYCYNVKATTN